jgi:hypothetical protein
MHTQKFQNRKPSLTTRLMITFGDLWSTSNGIDPVVSKYKAIKAVSMITEKFDLDDFFCKS